MRKFDYHRPRTLSEAFNRMEKLKGDAQYVAGGTDLIVRVKQGHIQPGALISLTQIEALRGVVRDGGLSLGSMTPIRDVEKHADIVRDYPALARAASLLANPQVRNVATVGGNLSNAAPSADSAPPLMVLEAVLTLEGPGGSREVPIDDFFAGPGQTCLQPTEILTRIAIPEKTPGTGTAFLKVGRVAQDIAIANAAALLVVKGKICTKCRLCAGAVAPVPLRLTRVEAALEGEEISPHLLEDVAAMVQEDVRPITDVRSTEAYRRIVSGVLVKRAITQALEHIA